MKKGTISMEDFEKIELFEIRLDILQLVIDGAMHLMRECLVPEYGVSALGNSWIMFEDSFKEFKKIYDKLYTVEVNKEIDQKKEAKE